MALGAALSFHQGRVGFMPLDQSIVFDGAWRLLGGQVPYRDFVLPNGLTPIAMQAVAFRLLGVSWSAYLAHAAVVNGLFAAFVYGLLRTLGLGRVAAFVHAAASGVVLYPPFGVPFMDQHAFFFVFLAACCAVGAARAGRGAAAFRWGAALGLSASAAVLAKQLPGALLPLPLVAAWLAAPPRHLRAVLGGALGAILAVTAGLALAGATAGIPFEVVRSHAFELPGAIGHERLASLAEPGALSGAVREVHRAWGLWSVGLAAAGALSLLPLAVRRARGTGDRRAAVALALAPALLVVCLAHGVLTLNQPHNAIPYAFAALGLLQVGVAAVLGSPAARALPCAILVAVAARDAWDFDARVNVPRRVHKLNRASGPLVDHPDLPPPLRPMAWWTPSEHAQTPRDLADTAAFLRGTGARFLLFGDTSVLYALAGQPSAGRALWLHAGLTYPRPGTPEFAAFERALLDSMARHRVEYVVLEGDRTYMRTTLSDFPALEERVRRDGCEARRFGVFTVIRLCAPP